MRLPLDTRLGSYEIRAVVAIGGTSEVYRAHDAKLDRDVAVKVLSDELADAAARRRFQREAQTASSLNHPHILTVHDVGEHEGRQYLVTELVDGGTLEQWAKAERRSWRQIVELLIGVADALATAHAAGILHRDVKPTNVLVTSTGYGKLADFGLVKLPADRRTSSIEATLAESHTRIGTVVGTIPYMSPEQASGRPVDARSDIFSFGVLLYELLAGRKPFEGTTDLGVLHAIASHSAPPLDPNLPADLRYAVHKMLEKDPSDRYQSARDLVVDLRRIARQSGEHELPPNRTRSLPRPLVIGAAFAAAAAIATAALLLRPPAETAISTGPQEYTPLTNFADSVTQPSVSPDGRLLTYIRGDSTFVTHGQVYVQVLPNGEPVQITNDDRRKMSPVFSPDGSRIAYTVVSEGAGWDTWSVPVLGGQPRPFLINASGLSWLPAGDQPRHVVYSAKTGQGIHMVIATATESGVAAQRLYAPPDVNGMAHRTAVSPDGRSVLVVEMLTGWLPCRLVPFEGGTARAAGPPGAPCTDAAWSPDGRWMYFSANTGNGYHIWRQRFPNGRPEQVTAGVTEEQGIAFFPDGRSFATSIGVEHNTLWLHEDGRDRQITSQGYAYLPKLSSDGKRLYYLLRSGVSTRTWVSGELWVTDLESGERARLLPDFLLEDYSLSHDGTRVVFSAIAGEEEPPIWVAPLDGSAPPHRLGNAHSPRPVFGPDDRVYFAEDRYLYRIDVDGTRRERLVDERVGPLGIVYDVSPSGRHAAVWARGNAVVIFALDGSPAVELCLDCGTVGAEDRGVTPPILSWSDDGRYLYLHSAWATRITYAVPLEPGESLPPLPAKAMNSIEEVIEVLGAEPLSEQRAFPGNDPSTYISMRSSAQRNIYQVPVP